MQQRHPPGLYVLFFTEMWERFGFYSMLAMFTLYLKDRERGFGWTAAEATLETQRRSGAITAETAGKLRAALLAARAIDAEESDRDLAFDLALKAQKLDPALVPAASVAAREHARRGAVRALLWLSNRYTP